MGIVATSFWYGARHKSAYDLLEYCHSLGAAGVQAELGSLEPADTERLRKRAEEFGMFLEVFARLPGADTSEFESLVRAAKQAGAVSLRAACLDGRRYETFSSLDEWKQFATDARARIARVVPIVEKQRMPLGIENHKDWTGEELAGLMKEYASEYLGVCLDTGNNIALLDDPMEVVERLAPYAVTTHIKDMAVEESADGFLLSEVPLGTGVLDMPRIVETITKARPRTNLNLEMITRDPLRIPCLAEKYWTTFPERSGLRLARTLAFVRAHKAARPLPRVETLDDASRRRVEEGNVKKCLAYAREKLRPLQAFSAGESAKTPVPLTPLPFPRRADYSF